MKAAIYCRVSTDIQEREGSSLTTQYEACIAKSKELGYEVTDEYTFREAKSGADFDRPLLIQVRELVKTEAIQAIICYATDRLARNPIHIAIIAEECQKHKVSLVFVSEPLDTSPEGQLIQYVKGYAAQIEREKIKDRSRRGRSARAKSGKLPTGRGVLYGYNYDKATGRNIANSCLKNVRQAGVWLIEEGISLNEVCRRFMAMGIPAPKGGVAWSRGTIGRIFRNTTYAGKCYAYKTRTSEDGKKRLTTDPDQRIEIPNAIDKAAFTWNEWLDIQKQLKRNREVSPSKKRFSYLLKGRVFCKQDGYKFYGIPIHDQPSYRCSVRHSIVPGATCRNKTYTAKKLEGIVWNEISKVLKEPELIFNEIGKAMLSEVEAIALKEQIDLYQRRIDELDDMNTRYGRMYGLGVWNEAKLLKEDAKIKREKIELTGKIEELEKRIDNARQLEWSAVKVREVCQSIGKLIDNCTFEEKELALVAMDVKVWIDGNSVEIEGIVPTDDMVHVSLPTLKKRHVYHQSLPFRVVV